MEMRNIFKIKPRFTEEYKNIYNEKTISKNIRGGINTLLTPQFTEELK